MIGSKLMDFIKSLVQHSTATNTAPSNAASTREDELVLAEADLIEMQRQIRRLDLDTELRLRQRALGSKKR